MRILKELKPSSNFTLQDIKEEEITVAQLEEMYKLSNSYEALFSKRAKMYKEMGLKNQVLNERDYKQYILQHYTFLKRPVIIINDEIFIGNSKKSIAAAKAIIG
jgi:arsenate reductase (glutaredoxin)